METWYATCRLHRPNPLPPHRAPDLFWDHLSLGLDANNPNRDQHRYKHYGREGEYDTKLDHLAVTLWRRMLPHLHALVSFEVLSGRY